jgi:hypothetical protein
MKASADANAIITNTKKGDIEAEGVPMSFLHQEFTDIKAIDMELKNIDLMAESGRMNCFGLHTHPKNLSSSIQSGFNNSRVLEKIDDIRNQQIKIFHHHLKLEAA